MTIESGHKDIKKLIIGDNAQFQIPTYQRTYTWEAKKHVEKLINDIIEFGREYDENTKSEYYIGNIIVKNRTRAFQDERVIIDGQQRITTTILVLCAIRDIYLNIIKTNEAIQAAKNISRALFTDNDGIVKLKLNNMENQNSLSKLLTGAIDTITADDKKTKYFENYQYLLKRLGGMKPDDFISFVNILDRVKVVIIFLDDAQDENSVFESINSLGKPLSSSDLIKNFIFTFKNNHFSTTEKEQLTNLYIKNFESLFSNEKKVEDELELFFRQYIAVKTFVLVNRDPKIIYYTFKTFVGEIEGFKQCKELIFDITKWAIIYQTIRVNSHKDIDQNSIEYLRSSFSTYSTLLMDIIDKHATIENGSIIVDDVNGLNRALKKVVAYDACRLLGGLPTKQITRFIPTIPKKLKNEFSDYRRDYAVAFEKLVTSAPEGYRQPSLKQLTRNVVEIDLYNRLKKQTLKFLILIENINKKELLSFERDLEKCQIEHIMPQTLSPEWKIPKDVHERYLHTLGNLSITLDNQGLSNKSFVEKKKILSDVSRINLNKLLLGYETFGEEEIRDRALKLLNVFIDAYGIKSYSEEHNKNDLLNGEVNIFSVDSPTHRKLEYAIFLGVKIRVSNITELYVSVFKKLYEILPDEFIKPHIAEMFNLKTDENELREPKEISSSHFIETNKNSTDKFKIIKEALSVFGLEDQLTVKFVEPIDAEKLLAELDSL
ncbi:MAG: DUF262 domain-containing HNH endonuclease family protein [Proteobacteria bacterium]|nr:DUF262 domain-containing HNH endonuclease family protein [Pseudomonadota bacterium]